MKKIVSVVLLLVLTCCVAYAEVNLSTMTTEELITLRTSIVKELMDRGALKSANVPAGEYVIGKDIPAGDYSITTTQILVNVIYGDFNMYMVTPDNSVGKITLKDGESFQFSSSITLTKYAGLSFN